MAGFCHLFLMNELEKRFKAVLDDHGEELEKAYAKVIKLSDKYGIPVGRHMPQKFRDDFQGGWDSETEEEIEGVTEEFVIQHCAVDEEYWQSSQFHCEVWYG